MSDLPTPFGHPSDLAEVIEAGLPDLRAMLPTMPDDGLGEAHDRAAALVRYLARKGNPGAAYEASNRVEIEIGHRLGSADGPGRPRKLSTRGQFLERFKTQDRVRFRTLAKYAADLEPYIRESRGALLARIRGFERREQAGASLIAEDCRVETGDFRDVAVDHGSVDLIVTDPPYDDDSLPLYQDLSLWANQVLKSGGICCIYAGNIRLPEVFDRVRAGGLQYRWTFCLNLEKGAHSRIFSTNVQQEWKPILICYRDRWREPPWGPDIIYSPGPEKFAHAWQQSLPPIVELIARYSEPGWVVADPFLGGGTTAVAALQTGRQFLGTDIDAGHVQTTLDRLGEVAS